MHYFSSYSFILLILRTCFSKLVNGVLTNIFTISTASSLSIFSPKATILESLSSLVYFASSELDTLAQRIPFTLLQAILIPIPLPQIATP